MKNFDFLSQSIPGRLTATNLIHIYKYVIDFKTIQEKKYSANISKLRKYYSKGIQL